MRLSAVAQSLLVGATGLGLLAGGAAAQVPEGAALGTQEEHPTITLPEPQPHWLYVLEPVFPYLVSSKVWILDGDTLDYLGMASAGYVANLVLSHDRSAFYIAETYWDRGTRGKRTDVVTFYDPRKVEATGEVVLPAGRFLVVPKKHNAQLTTDGRYLLSFNMDPSFGLSVVDLQQRKYLGEIETGGCSLAFPTGPSSVASLCPDGSFAHTTFDAEGNAEIENGEPFFDSENDPVFEHAALHRPSQKAFFISYEGWVYPVALNGMPEVGETLEAPGRGPGGRRLAPGRLAARRLPRADRPAVRADARRRHLDAQAGGRGGLGVRRDQPRAPRAGAARASLALDDREPGRPAAAVRVVRDRGGAGLRRDQLRAQRHQGGGRALPLRALHLRRMTA